MFGIKLSLWIRSLLLTLFVGAALELATSDAEARAGRGRSSGRSSSYGSKQSSPPPQQTAPNQYGNPNAAGNPPMNANRGGFMRSMAGGLAGGFLGSMLFSSFGHAAGGLGTQTAGGGIGLLEIILFAGLAYFVFRWWKGRQQAATAFSGMARRHGSADLTLRPANVVDAIDMRQFRALDPLGIDSEVASDLFFKVQGAWTRRDLSPVRDLISAEMQETLERDILDLKHAQQINRLENISVRRTEVTNSWNEGRDEYSTVRFSANLLDYTVDEKTGAVVDGSDVVPVKFEEEWTFAKLAGTFDWRLAGIQQV